MELNGMCLIWGWQSSNCFLFELLPAWLGTVVIETIMFHSSLGIICLKIHSVLFYSSSWNPSLYHYGALRGALHFFCVPRFWPGLGNSSTQRTWSWCFPGPAPLPPLALAMGSSARHLSSPRSLFCLWLTAQVSISLQGSSNSPSKLRICSGFVNI